MLVTVTLLVCLCLGYPAVESVGLWCRWCSQRAWSMRCCWLWQRRYQTVWSAGDGRAMGNQRQERGISNSYLLTWCLQCFDAVGWAAGRASGPVKTEWWGAGMVICLERGADFHMAQLMPLPLTVSCSSKIQIGFTFLVPAHPGSPGQRADKWMYVCVCYLLTHVHITNKYKHV